ncbi:MAG: efflux RND transporter periplasmic adaptor subunit [Bacteroidaceae bacterium]|nr:efflux RND transporter periplasmic adaptor subunit [Bacteroidaceae bacterium]
MDTKKKIIGGVATLLFIGALATCMGGGPKPVTVNLGTTKVMSGSISSTVTATGTIEPVTKVEVGTQVSGIIDKIYVDYNSEVKKGQVIAEMDRRNLTSQLTTAQSDLISAKSNLEYQESNFNRYKKLYEKGLISTNEYESANLSYIQAKESYRGRQESVRTAQQNLAYATITSPIDGVILSKAVEEGQTVAAGFSTPTLFTIAQDLTDMRVIADIDEADIGMVKEGQRVNFTVDAFPDDTFEGKVTQVRQEATTTSNVVTYEVVISAPNKDLKLMPGLTANVTIYTQEKENVTYVPTKAVRLNPTEEALEKGGQIIDCEGKDKVWVKEGKNLKAIPVKVGLNTGSQIEILSGVSAGTEIVSEIITATPEQKGGLMMGPPGGRR